MDWRTWIRQSLPRTEIMRGGATVWEKGATGLLGDTLGPVMHAHDKASEVFYFVAGRCRLEIGNSEEFSSCGDFVLVPPNTPHNLWNAGDDDLLVFWIVAPHFANNKWYTEPFVPGAMERRAIRSHIAPGANLPSNAQIQSRMLTLNAMYSGQTAVGQEAVLYVVDGQADVKVGKLGGRLTANDFVHVPVDTIYSVTPVSRAPSVMMFEMPGG